MLVLSRKKGETVVIGRDIEVIVLSVSGNRVKLGLQGPASVPFRRGELSAKPTRRSAAAGRLEYA